MNHQTITGISSENHPLAKTLFLAAEDRKIYLFLLNKSWDFGEMSPFSENSPLFRDRRKQGGFSLEFPVIDFLRGGVSAASEPNSATY